MLRLLLKVICISTRLQELSNLSLLSRWMSDSPPNAEQMNQAIAWCWLQKSTVAQRCPIATLGRVFLCRLAAMDRTGLMGVIAQCGGITVRIVTV